MNTVKADLVFFLLLLILNTRAVNSVSKKTGQENNKNKGHELAVFCPCDLPAILSPITDHVIDNEHLL